MSAKELLIQLFNLPKGEIIFQDYSCALRGIFSKYGRIFITENNLCFYANIAGSKTKLVLKLDDVQRIDKKHKNDIEIFMKNGNQHGFNNFQDRDQVYNMMQALLTGAPIETTVIHSSQVEQGQEQDQGEPNTEMEVSFLAGNQKDGEQELAKLTFNINLDKFFEYFLADNATLYGLLDHRTVLQDNDIQLSLWQEENEGTFTRELKTIIKLVDVPFKDRSRLHKLQSYKKENDKITLNATTHTLDVPYASYFQTEERWEVIQVEENKCVMRIFGCAVLTKSTIMKGTILPRTLQGLKDDYEKWANNVKIRLEAQAKTTSKKAVTKDDYENLTNLEEFQNKPKQQVQQIQQKVQQQNNYYHDPVIIAMLALLIFIMAIQVFIQQKQSRQIDELQNLVQKLIQIQ